MQSVLGAAPVYELPAAARLPEGADLAAHVVRGWWRRRRSHARQLRALAQECVRACQALEGLEGTALASRLQQARDGLRHRAGASEGQADAASVAALALAGAVAARTLRMRPYPVQFMAALALHRGWLAEMATGEGKTLTVGLAAVLGGWTGRPCHVVTSNDYLAIRDAQQMRPLFEACGLTVAGIEAGTEPAVRRQAYAADVVYVTAKELLADFLRDELAARGGRDPTRMAFEHWLCGDSRHAQGTGRLLSRGLHSAIVDEADNVLIDEAVTPLILSAPRHSHGLEEAARLMAGLADRLREGVDYALQRQRRAVVLEHGARLALARCAQELPAMWRAEPRREELLRQALTVRHFILRDHQYVVEEGKIVLLDEFTGRMTPGRTLTAGLHQAVEAREGIEITDPNESLGQLSFQTFFRRFPRLSGTSGTAREAAAEFWRIYRLAVLPVPTHRPRLTQVLPTRVLPSADLRWRAVAEHVREQTEAGRPVLIGVRSVEASLVLAQELRRRGVEFELLNAVLHAQEARIIEQAGQAGRVTIATNMAGRGTDIRLGPGVPEAGGLQVVIAEANESSRVDRQLAGRCGRQGDPGGVVTLLSLEDGLARRFLPSVVLRGLRAASARQWPGRDLLLAWMLRAAQKRAEADAFARRRSVLKSDDWLDRALPFEGR